MVDTAGEFLFRGSLLLQFPFPGGDFLQPSLSLLQFFGKAILSPCPGLQFLDLALHHPLLRGEVCLCPGDEPLDLVLALGESHQSGEFIIEGVVLPLHRDELSVAFLDSEATGPDGFVFFDPGLMLSYLALPVVRFLLRLGDALFYPRQLLILEIEGFLVFAQVGEVSFLALEVTLDFGDGRLDALKFLFVFRLPSEFAIDLRNIAFQPFPFSIPFPTQLPCPLLEIVVDRKPQDFAEHPFSLAGGFSGELSGTPLHQEGAIDEGLVIHAQGISYLVLRFADRVAGDRIKAPVVHHLKFQQRLARATRSRSGPLTDNAVSDLPGKEFELNPHLALSLVDEVIVAPGPALSPEGPGHGIEQSGFAVAVIAAEASDVDAGKIQRRGVVAVAHEVA
ncbi:MAG: hypothetical protein DDT28_01263 [Dehalococcoidia bacterium]|nr:hypothetical protein [Chloroflexota bacterium]